VGSDAHAERGTGLGKHWGTLIFYGVVSAQTEKVVEFFLERDAAEAMIETVWKDDPGLAVLLRVEAVELVPT
jgi:hypothetical protein